MSPPRRKPHVARRGRRRAARRDARLLGRRRRGRRRPSSLIRPADDPTAMIRSLGPPPLPGRETIAEHYFAAVYDKAATLAVALAAASGLLAPDDPDD